MVGLLAEGFIEAFGKALDDGALVIEAFGRALDKGASDYLVKKIFS